MPAGVRALVLIAVLLAALSPANARGLRLDGNPVQGGLMIGYASPGARVYFEGAEIRLSSENQRVHRGVLIGRVGATGRATGAHLDWRMNWFDTRIDPALLARGTPQD